MKIVNVCLCGPYNEGWGYQENLLSKYQYLNGNDVSVVTSIFVNDKNSESYNTVSPGIYYDNNIKIIRLESNYNDKIAQYLRCYEGFLCALENEKPDLIFVHGLQFLDSLKLCKYLKNHKNVKCVVDNHADFTNSANTFVSRFIHLSLWKYCAKRINKYVDVFYGVLPLRCDFLRHLYGIEESKIKLLVMGADDELLKIAVNSKEETRMNLGIKSDEFVLLTGGKIDNHKTEILNLMDAVNKCNRNIKLLIFGSIISELKDQFISRLSDKIIFLNWLNQEDIYRIIAISDFGIFPGRHSVIWEQMIAAGVPCAFKDIENTHHVDIGGNVVFLKDTSEKSISNLLESILEKEYYCKLKNAAMSEARFNFYYSNIAKKSVEV